MLLSFLKYFLLSSIGLIYHSSSNASLLVWLAHWYDLSKRSDSAPCLRLVKASHCHISLLKSIYHWIIYALKISLGRIYEDLYYVLDSSKLLSHLFIKAKHNSKHVFISLMSDFPTQVWLKRDESFLYFPFSLAIFLRRITENSQRYFSLFFYLSL